MSSSSIIVSVSPSELQKINLVVCGSDGSVKSSVSDLILDQRSEFSGDSRSVCVKREAEVCGRLITLVELPALYSSQLSEEEVMRESLRCVSLCDPGVHAFLLVLAEGRLTDEDKGELEKIQNTFSSRFTHHTITIIPTETQQEGAELDEDTRTFNKTCSGGCYIFGSVPDVSGLIDRVQQLLMEKNGDLYTPQMFLDGQLETQLRRYNSKVAEMTTTIQNLEMKIQTFSKGRRQDALRIVLLGRTGSGKSATGNTILGKENTFEHSSSCMCQKETAEVNGRQITVIDTPGLFDTPVGNVEIQKEITKCIFMAAPGPHVFLLVLKVRQRFSEEEKGTVEIIQNIFGEESVTYTMLLFTGGDLPKDMIFQYFGDPGSDIRNLITNCGNRLHFFNNKQIRDRTQVTVLLEKIDSMLAVNGGSCYTNEMFQQVEKGNQERILKEKEEEIKREKEELRVRFEAEIDRMKTTLQEEIKYERKRREEEFKEREHQLEEKHRNRGDEYENRRKEDEKRINDRERAIFSLLERQQAEFERQRHEDQKRREQEDEKMREREEREEEKRRERENLEEEKSRNREEREKREWEERREKEREEYKGKLEELMRNLEEEERKRSDLNERIKLSEEKHMKELEELKHHLEFRVQEEVKTKEKLIEEHQEELERVRKSMERQQAEFERQRHEDQKIREQEDDKRREREKREDEKRRARVERERREWEKRKEKEKEEYKGKLEELKRNLEEEERKRSDLEEKIKLSDEKHMKELEELEHLQKELEIRIQEEVKTKEKLIEEHQEELERLRKSMERQQAEFERQRHEDQKIREHEDKKRRERVTRERREMEKGREEYKGKLDELKRNLEEEERKRSDLNVRKMLSEEKHMKELEELEHLQKELESRIQEEVKTKEKLTEEHQEEIERVRKSMEEKDLQLKKTMEEKRAGGNGRKQNQKKQKEEKSEVLNKRLIEDLFRNLGLEDTFKNRLSRAHFLEITPSLHNDENPINEQCLVHAFMQQILKTDYRGRHLSVKSERPAPKSQHTAGKDVFGALLQKNAGNKVNKPTQVHPMDVQMAVFLCSDAFLQQIMVTKLSQCQYAVPLLVPNPFTGNYEFPLWTMRQISKSWKTTDTSGRVISKTLPMYKAQTPMMAFFRIGSISSSKSQLMNRLINEKQDTFFHRDCPGSSRERLLMDGVVEIAWYLPSGKSTDHFSDCVAFCNLHGDSSINETQRKILTEMSSVNVVLLPQLDENDNKMVIVKELCEGLKPLIVVLTDEEDDDDDDDDDDAVCEIGERKYRVSLKDRNQSDVSVALREVIKNCLSEQPVTFSVEKIAEHSEMKVDENNEECQRGKEAAQEMMRFLEREDPSTVKEKYLPCQGKLWHDWSQKNKDLRRLKSDILESEKGEIEKELREIRRKQLACGFSELMKLFVGSLRSLSDSEKMYFLNWTTILLDDFTSDTLSDILQEYNQKWAEMLALKRGNDIKISHELWAEQLNLEKISNKLNAATFGLEHMLREMGQIYEASVSERREDRVKDGDLSYLPELAAELMISGNPMELMDGDAAHVPLVWVSAVLDEVIRKLGDQRVFVLSVLGIQSSGKSTMLNAMFGLQFAVSAGRCTRGAFMQLVKVSEEMKEELKFDYILVVDTEGLRALELAGTDTIHHDNELATFVVGLGNMTLIENPSEMQDILQIVVQAFMRMKQVRLNPSCVFVHQNVTDVAAGEKMMEGRRRVQEKLDEMTRLAAKDEVCDAECFSDVITFDVQKDVKYFSQLWEGSPPMAPPNPRYSENVQELKRDIVSRASKTSCMKLSQFQQRVKDLWEALLNENFVFSFRNTLEISVYRKLEEEYEKWTWSLRSAMLSIEDKMLNRISSGKLEAVGKQELMREMSETLQKVQISFKKYFEEDSEKETLIQWKSRFEKQIQHVHDDLVDEAKRKLDENIKQKNIRKNLDEQLKNHENTLFEKSKEFALKLKVDRSKNRDPKAEFDSVWGKWVSELTTDVPKIKDVNILEDVFNILGEFYEYDLVVGQKKSAGYKMICTVGDYLNYVSLKKNKFLKVFSVIENIPFMGKALKPEDQISIRELISKVIHQTTEKVKLFPVSVQGYSSGYIQELARDVKQLVQELKPRHDSFEFKKEFYVDLSLYVCDQAEKRFKELHRKYKEANDPLLYFERKKAEYVKVFENYWKGATSAAVLGDQICVKLKETMLQSVYNMIAKFICDQMRGKPPFNGNRGDLEKHILKTLAEQEGDKEEKFKNFLTYMYLPRAYFEMFIKRKVKEHMAARNPQAVSAIKEHFDYKQRIVISAAKMARDEVMDIGGDVNTWLDIFSNSLVDELGDTSVHLGDGVTEDVTDYDILLDFIQKELPSVVAELKGSFCKLSDLKEEMFREKPEEILIKHFCRCCWTKCPFCGAVCTNSQEDHTGDHHVDFHRSSGIIGRKYRGTTEFVTEFCTTLVASEKSFYPLSDSDWLVPYKQYRTAGEHIAKWCISSDFSEMAYWKWFVCEFQENLENHYQLTFSGNGEIPSEWTKFTQADAVASLGIN